MLNPYSTLLFYAVCRVMADEITKSLEGGKKDLTEEQKKKKKREERRKSKSEKKREKYFFEIL